MPFLDTPAGRLFYTDEGDGPACILVHSLGLSSAMWRSTVARLRGRRRVLAIDCRGHGRSTAESFSFDGVVDDLERLTDTLGIDDADVVGISMGGKIAVLFHARQPDRVRSLVVADSFAGAAPDPDARLAETRAKLDALTMPEFGADYMTSRLMPATPAAVHAEFASVIGGMSKTIYLETLREIVTRDVDPLLAGIAVPTLVLVGEHDWSTPLAASQHLAGTIAGALLQVIPEAGHLANLDNPAAFDDAAAGFIAMR